VIDDPKLVKHGVEEGTPHTEVVLGKVEYDRDVCTDVYMLDRCRGDGVGIGGGFSKGVGGVDGARHRGGWA
jgi:hypothetical protein